MKDWATGMKSESRNLRQEERIGGARKTYCAPKLRSFGSVGALTQSGTGTQMENNGSMMGPTFFP